MIQALLTRAEEKLIRSLHRRKGRERHGLFLVEGVRAVEACLDSGWPWRLAVVTPALEETERGARLSARLRESRRTVVRCGDERFSRIAATQTPQGVLLAAELRRAESAHLSPPEHPVCLVLDAVQDPGNVGTLIRSAHALGCFAVFALPGTADPWGPKTVRATAGGVFHLPIATVSWAEARAWLREHRFEILGADVGGEPFRRDGRRAGPEALVLGNEGAGLSQDVRRECDRIVSVPIAPTAESLNVAVAGAILLDRLIGA